MQKYICEFCDADFTRKHTMKNHQKTVKKCIELQGGSLNKTSCPAKNCNESFSRSDHLDRHKKVCKYIHKEKQESKLHKYKRRNKKLKTKLSEADETLMEADDNLMESEGLILRLKKHIRRIKKEYKKSVDQYDEVEYERDELLNNVEDMKIQIQSLRELLAKDEGKIEVYREVIDKPKNVTTNYINQKLADIPIANIRPFTIETVREDISNGKYTYPMFLRGARGLTEFVNNMIIEEVEEEDESSAEPQLAGEGGPSLHPERNYVCTDSSRNKFHRLLESKDWKSDNGAHFLGKVMDELSPLAKEYYLKNVDMLRNAKTEDDREHADTLIRLTKDVYIGISRPKSTERRKLFKKLRSEIKSSAAV